MTTTTESIAAHADLARAAGQKDTQAALRFITCGSVDDGKSTLIGRLLVDSRAVLQDQLAGVTRAGEADLALLTDGLAAEREQGITIDVAYRYFATPARKFIIGDAPGHEQYTRNMVTAASSADAAVVLVDATKLDWQQPDLALLPQTRRHALLLALLRVPSVLFAVNKLDAVAEPERAWRHIRAALEAFAERAALPVAGVVPISALHGWNVAARGAPAQAHGLATADGGAAAQPAAPWCGYDGPALLEWLERLPVTPTEDAAPLAFPVQWVEKPSAHAPAAAPAPADAGRRIFWGRVATGRVVPGAQVQVLPSGQPARVAAVLGHDRAPLGAGGASAGHSAGLVLDRELDVSRGDWLVAARPAEGAADVAAVAGLAVAGEWADSPAAAPLPTTRTLHATVAWLDDEPLVAGRVYWLLHGHRWVKARVARVAERLDIHTLERTPASALQANAIGDVELHLQHAIPARPYAQSRALGAAILVDTTTHRTAGAVLAR